MRLLLPVLATCALIPSAALADEATAEDWVAQSRVLVERLGSALKAELGAALASGGPVAAIEVCRDRAPALAAQLSRESGATVGRTALKLRNPANAPDALQRVVLEQFAGEMASGRFTPPLEAAFEMRAGERIERHYLRAIPTEPVCVTCHGARIAPEIAAAIARSYPSDQATGFEPGQLRGAFTVRWPDRPAADANTH